MKFPEMREELIGYLEGLSDRQYQNDCWVNGHCPDGVETDEFDFTVHFLFDDTELATNPSKLIGFVLADVDEATLIRQLCQEISQIFTMYGTDLSDQEYISCHEWEKVVAAAGKALVKITEK